MDKLSIIVPTYRESNNLNVLSQRLFTVMSTLDVEWEWIIVDDHSPDATFEIVRALAKNNFKLKGIRLSRNIGSFSAIMCGLTYATGDCAVVLAADLQDPPETIPLLLEKWHGGAQIVWAVRAKREGESMSTRAFSRLYYLIMRKFVGVKGLPPTGADFFLLDRKVVDSIGRFKELNISLIPLLTWMGFRQDSIQYDKQARLHGSSGWSVSKKIKLVVDSVISFSFLPIRLMSIVGAVLALIGFIYASFIIYNAIAGGNPVQGWTSLMVVVLVIGGLQMLMMGVLGEYLWRALDESRGRPRYIIEEEVGMEESKINREET